MIYEGLKMMVVGMGVVYAFLILMIWCMKLAGKLLAPYSHLLAPPAAPAKKKSAAGVDPAQIAAAVAAVHANNK